MNKIPRKDRAFGVWHTKKQTGAKRQHKGSGGGRRAKWHQQNTEAPIVRRRKQRKK